MSCDTQATDWSGVSRDTMVQLSAQDVDECGSDRVHRPDAWSHLHAQCNTTAWADVRRT